MTGISDASAMLALARDKPGADTVEHLLLDDESIVHVHALNLCEMATASGSGVGLVVDQPHSKLDGR